MEINKYGAFNCLLSDGEYLFAYKGVDSLNGTRDLYFLKREPPYEMIKMEDDDYNINLGNVKNCSEKGFIIATNPLTNEYWRSFEEGELMVFKDGEMIYSNKRLTDLELRILKILRESSHRVSLERIIKNLNFNWLYENTRYDDSIVKIGIRSLLDKRYIKQDSRDNVNWDNLEATFYTRKPKRAEINKKIKNLKIIRII